MGVLKLTATAYLMVKSLAFTTPSFIIGVTTPTLPTELSRGQTIRVPITFTPDATGLVTADLVGITSAGVVHFAVSGTGQAKAGKIVVSMTHVNFGEVPAGGTPNIEAIMLTNAPTAVGPSTGKLTFKTNDTFVAVTMEGIASTPIT